MKRIKPNSEWKQRSHHSLAQGFPGTNSKRWTHYVNGVFPSHGEKGEGCYIYDAWGNRYLDFVCALGAISIGYSNSRFQEALIRQVYKGPVFSLPDTLEVEVAEQIKALVPAAQKVRFLKTGNEAALAAIRAARAYTKRRNILSRGYHGHGDIFTSLTPPALGVEDQFYIQSFLSPETIEQSHSLAAVIIEALELEMSEEWLAYLRAVRKACDKVGALLILDEVITGFRVPTMTVSKMWDVQPDLILLGKGIANGYPLSVVAGRKEVMDSNEYFVSSTFSGESISLTAARETIAILETEKNLKDLLFYGERLRTKLNSLDSEIQFKGYGTRASLNATHPKTALFMQEMMKSGILLGKAWFFNFAHLEANIEDIVITTAKDCLTRINRGDVQLEGSLPEEAFAIRKNQ